MKKGFIFLLFAISFEVFGTTMLKLTDGFSNLIPTIGFIIGMGVSFYSLSLCLRYLPLSLAYAIWSGAGTALTALIGVILWKEPFGIATSIGLVLIIGGVVLLNVPKKTGEAASASN